MVESDVSCIYTVLDASAPFKGGLQASLASLVFQGRARLPILWQWGVKLQPTTLN